MPVSSFHSLFSVCVHVYTCVHKQACTLVTALMWMSEDGFWEGVFFFYHVDSGISSDLATSTFTCEPSYCSVCACILDRFQQGRVLKLLLLVDVQFPQHSLSKRMSFVFSRKRFAFPWCGVAVRSATVAWVGLPCVLAVPGFFTPPGRRRGSTLSSSFSVSLQS